jgi:low temperature requirement protein LtrA
MRVRGTGRARARLHAPEPQEVTFVELFFDLVFVFAVTQVTHLTATHLTAGGVTRSVVLFWLIWWAWTQFTWTLNPADTESTLVRACTLVATSVAFVMAASVERAYGEDPLWFALPYIVVRLLGLWLQVRIDLERGELDDRAVRRWALWSVLALGIVLAGTAVDPADRAWVWALAIAGDLGAASFASRSHRWDIHPAHFCERHGLFVIIALGESLIVAGTAVAGEERPAVLVAAAGAGLLVACLLWWTYFGWLKGALEHGLADAPPERLGTLARDAFSLGHFGLVCGIVGFAVALEEIVAHPDEAASAPIAALGTGVALFVGSSALALWRLDGRVLVPRLVLLVGTLVAVAALSGQRPVWPLLAVAAGLAAVVVVEGTGGSGATGRIRPAPAGGRTAVRTRSGRTSLRS